MSDKTAIEWTDATWNPIRARNRATRKVGWFCVHVSPGCANCYAEPINRRLGTAVDYKAQLLASVEIFADEKALTIPLHWKRPRKIFVGSMTDLFGEFVPDEIIDRVFAVMALSPQHTFQVLTKRPERMRKYVRALDEFSFDGVEEWEEAVERVSNDDDDIPPPGGYELTARLDAAIEHVREVLASRRPLPNVWLGVSAEDQERADDRITVLLDTPAAKRFVSLEPLLGAIDLRHVQAERHVPEDHETDWKQDALSGGFEFLDDLGVWCGGDGPEAATLDWVIVGGESGPHARPMHPDWARQIRDDCAAAGVPFFFKQWGEWEEVDDGSPPGEHLRVEVDERGRPDEIFAEDMLAACDHPAWIARDGRVFTSPLDLPPEVPCRLIDRVGKRNAGRLLDAVTHDGMPT